MSDNSLAENSAKQDIFNHARTLFAKKGFDGVSVREIAKESGQNISMIGYYFGSKEGLYKSILSENMLKVSGQVISIFKDAPKKEMNENELIKKQREI